MKQFDNDVELIHHEVATDDELEIIEPPIGYKPKKHKRIILPAIVVVQPQIQELQTSTQPEMVFQQETGPKTFRNMFQKGVIRSLQKITTSELEEEKEKLKKSFIAQTIIPQNNQVSQSCQDNIEQSQEQQFQQPMNSYEQQQENQQIQQQQSFQKKRYRIQLPSSQFSQYLQQQQGSPYYQQTLLDYQVQQQIAQQNNLKQQQINQMQQQYRPTLYGQMQPPFQQTFQQQINSQYNSNFYPQGMNQPFYPQQSYPQAEKLQFLQHTQFMQPQYIHQNILGQNTYPNQGYPQQIIQSSINNFNPNFYNPPQQLQINDEDGVELIENLPVVQPRLHYSLPQQKHEKIEVKEKQFQSRKAKTEYPPQQGIISDKKISKIQKQTQSNTVNVEDSLSPEFKPRRSSKATSQRIQAEPLDKDLTSPQKLGRQVMNSELDPLSLLDVPSPKLKHLKRDRKPLKRMNSWATIKKLRKHKSQLEVDNRKISEGTNEYDKYILHLNDTIAQLNQEDPNQKIPDDLFELLQELGEVIVETTDPNDIESRKGKLQQGSEVIDQDDRRKIKLDQMRERQEDRSKIKCKIKEQYIKDQYIKDQYIKEYIKEQYIKDEKTYHKENVEISINKLQATTTIDDEQEFTVDTHMCLTLFSFLNGIMNFTAGKNRNLHQKYIKLITYKHILDQWVFRFQKYKISFLEVTKSESQCLAQMVQVRPIQFSN